MILFIALTLILAGVIRYLLNRPDKQSSIPGPRGVPFFGCIFNLGKYPHKVMSEWHKQYGPIYRNKMVWMESVTIGDIGLIKEAFNLPEFSGRPDIEAAVVMNGGKRGLIMCEGDGWIEQRRFTLRHLRDFGFGKRSMEGVIQEEVSEVIEWLAKNTNQPISLEHRFTIAILNALWLIVAGERFNHEDPKLIEIHQKASSAYAAILKKPLVIFMPRLNHIFPGLTGWTTFLEDIRGLFGLFREVISTHKRSIGECSEPRDFVDLYLKEAEKTQNPNSTFYGEEGELSLLSVIAGLFAGGTETTSVTLMWTFLYLVTYPEVQARLHEEIDRVVGSGVPSLSDQPKMVYTNATMHEIFRKSSIVPLGVAHKLHKDVEFHGFKLKKGVAINANTYHVHHDPEKWSNPEEFNPDRFIKTDGSLDKEKVDNLMPFSMGRRVCIGESMARQGFFLFMVGILQRFQVSYVGEGQPSLEASWGATLHPQPYQVIFKERAA